MFGPRLFRSRWAALLWAGGMIWFACSVAADPPRAPERVTGATAQGDPAHLAKADLATR